MKKSLESNIWLWASPQIVRLVDWKLGGKYANVFTQKHTLSMRGREFNLISGCGFFRLTIKFRGGRLNITVSGNYCRTVKPAPWLNY